jgi:hypothetical protein
LLPFGLTFLYKISRGAKLAANRAKLRELLTTDKPESLDNFTKVKSEALTFAPRQFSL